MRAFKILIVEDEKGIVKLIKYNLENSGYETIVTNNGEDAIETLKTQEIDLVILDIMLPGIDGLEVCKLAKQDKDIKSIPIIILTAKSEEIDRILGFELGADDYITKPFSPRELILRIKAILKRSKKEAAPSSEFLSAGNITINIPRHEALVKNKRLDLTRMEFKLLCKLVEGKGCVQPRDRLLADVWGIDTTLETRTIDTHIKSLRTKLGKSGKMIHTVRGIGYKLIDRDNI